MKHLLSYLFCCLLPLGLSAVEDTAELVAATAPGAAFLQGEPLEFRLGDSPALPATWTLKNWNGTPLRQGELTERKLVMEPLPNGYYRLEIKGFNGFRSFAVVPDPAGRAANPEQFFALDSAQSWLARVDRNNPRQPSDPYDVVSEVARRSGTRMVRERLSWPETEPAPGQYDWKQYKRNADLLSRRGVTVLGLYHHTPEWLRKQDDKLPTDLAATWRYAKKAAETFRGQMSVWEFWNEPDIGFTTEAAWDYAAVLKAASLGFKAADPKLPVAIGGYAITPLLPYADVVMANGAGEFFDIFSVHTYRSISEFPGLVRNIREHMARHGIADYPVWFTENGSNMEGAGRIDSFLPGLKAHSPEQELLIAEYLPKMMITMRMLGVTRDFFFVLPPYNEGGGSKDWGLMRRDFTVKPGYAAFATLVDQLGDAESEGEVRLGEHLKAFLFRRANGSRVLAYWTLTELDTDKPRPNLSNADLRETEFALPFAGELRGVDLFGTPFTAEAKRIPASRYPRFLTPPDGLRADVPVNFPKPSPLRTRTPDGNAPDRTIVFRTELSDDFKLFTGKDSADIKRTPARLRLQVWNLSDEEKSGRISVSGGESGGIPEQLTLPPFGKQEFDLTFSPRLDREFKGELRVDGDFQGRRTTPLVIPLQSLAEMTGTGPQQEMPRMLDPAGWKKNTSGETEIVYGENENAIRFSTVFPGGVDRWSYPEFPLQLPQESLAGALGIGFEVKISRADAVKQMLLMAVVPGKPDLYLKVEAPKEVYEERFVAFPPSPAPETVTKLRLGINALRDDVALSVRNIRVFYRR